MGLSYVVESSTNKTFFTYFSEFEKAWDDCSILVITVLSVLFVVSVGGNILVISFFVRFKAFRQVTNLFITNLAVSDLLFSVMIPLVMTTRATGEWIFGEVPCHMLAAIEFVSGIVSVWTLVLISADRYRAIVKLQARRSTLRGTLIRVGIVWIGALVFSSPIAMFFTTVQSTITDASGSRTVMVCSLAFPGPEYIPLIYSCINIVVVFIVPLTIITWNYRAIMRKFSSSLQRMRNHMVAAPQSQTNSVKAAANVQREGRVMKMLIAMVLTFVLFWGPVTMFIVALTADYHNQIIESYQLTAVFTFTYANTALNPVVYGILNEQYQSHFRRVFNKARCKDFVRNVSVRGSEGTGQGDSLQNVVIRTVSGRDLDKRFETSGRDNGCYNEIG